MLQTRQSAVSSTDWGVDMINKICKLRDTSGSFVLCFIHDMVLSEFYVQGNSFTYSRVFCIIIPHER